MKYKQGGHDYENIMAEYEDIPLARGFARTRFARHRRLEHVGAGLARAARKCAFATRAVLVSAHAGGVTFRKRLRKELKNGR